MRASLRQLLGNSATLHHSIHLAKTYFKQFCHNEYGGRVVQGNPYLEEDLGLAISGAIQHKIT